MVIIVEIKIDTKKDSAEEIKKAIEFLKNFLEKDEEVSPGAFNMFNNPTIDPPKEVPDKEAPAATILTWD